MNLFKHIIGGLSITLLLISCNNLQNNEHPYGLDVLDSMKTYKAEIRENPDMALISLDELIPNLVLDMRYATPNNFTGEVVYDHPAAFLRKPAAEALLRVQQNLARMNMGLKVFDAYRPYAATVKFYEIIGDTNYVASPWHGSRHNRGAAVDVSLISLETGEELPMPTAFDEFSEKAASDYMDLPEEVIHNRTLLIRVMAEEGFTVYPTEWWHFDYTDWERFGLMDVKISELASGK